MPSPLGKKTPLMNNLVIKYIQEDTTDPGENLSCFWPGNAHCFKMCGVTLGDEE